MEKFVTSPYNFVELSDEIIFPDWAKQVSHDIPFSDGLDGELEIKVEAVTPVYIRDSASKKNEERSSEFFKCEDGKYYIPGTSLKGMVRNVLEIASYGKMQHVANKRYSLRDLHLDKYKNEMSTKKVKAGFLDISDDNKWSITPCSFEKFQRSLPMEQNDPEKRTFVFGNGSAQESGVGACSTQDKYYEFFQKYASTGLKINAGIEVVTAGGRTEKKAIVFKDENRNKYCGYLVFTGQPSRYSKSSEKVKKNEFFFYDLKENETFAVDDQVYVDESGNEIYPNREDFLFIHGVDDSAISNAKKEVPGGKSTGNVFCSWKYGCLKKYRERYYNGRIPVFYIKEGNSLKIGLTQMFRLAGISVGEALQQSNPKHFPALNNFEPDLADLIFGYATAESSLRGRVQFTACLAENIEKSEPKTYQIVPGSPKPSFYPAYLQQKGENYQTFLDANARLSGWKRYPALGGKRDFSALVQNDEPVQNQNMQVVFTPLPEKTTFSGKIRFHNLRPIELGALLWSLKLRNPKHHCHTIGMAKPYGFGRVKIHIQEHPDFTEEWQDKYIKQFTDFVWNKLKETETYSHISNFQNLPQITMLLRMTEYDNRKIETGKWCFEYPVLADFADIKRNKQVLGEYPEPVAERTPPAAPAVREKSCEEKFLEALPAKLKDCVKMLKEVTFTDTKFSEEQIRQIKNRYPELKLKINYKNKADCDAFNAEIEKHKA